MNQCAYKMVKNSQEWSRVLRLLPQNLSLPQERLLQHQQISLLLKCPYLLQGKCGWPEVAPGDLEGFAARVKSLLLHLVVL